jgi:hypothetical protein
MSDVLQTDFPFNDFLKHLAGAMAFLVPFLRPFFRGLRGAARARPTITMRGVVPNLLPTSCSSIEREHVQKPMVFIEFYRYIIFR